MKAFERRCALYEGLDQDLCSYTRFFAAAALTNSVLAKLYSVRSPMLAPHSYAFLNELGDRLEETNLRVVRAIPRQPARGYALDLQLVSCEQRLVQVSVEGLDSRCRRYWRRARRELNALLNERLLATLFSGWFSGSRRYTAVLRGLRRNLGVALDFANQTHRERIGLGLIQDIRGQRRITAPLLIQNSRFLTRV